MINHKDLISLDTFILTTPPIKIKKMIKLFALINSFAIAVRSPAPIKLETVTPHMLKVKINRTVTDTRISQLTSLKSTSHIINTRGANVFIAGNGYDGNKASKNINVSMVLLGTISIKPIKK